MPHECVGCGEVYADGATEVFDGCPSCDGTKFFYVREVSDAGASGASPADAPVADPKPEDGDAAEVMESAPGEAPSQSRARAETAGPELADWPDPLGDEYAGEGDSATEGERDADGELIEARSEYEDGYGGRFRTGDSEGGADVDDVSADGTSASSSTRYERVGGEEARQRLMEQFETIRIVEPGSYELNLMNLYDRDEKIIALQEDGCYQVSLPSFEG